MRRIETLLEETDGVALRAYADLKRELLPKGERDGTDDIPNMSRTDHVWSAAMVYGLAALFRYRSYTASVSALRISITTRAI